MTVVANIGEIAKKLDALGWTSALVNRNEIIQAVRDANLPGPVIAAYLDALIASPDSLDDTKITGVTAQQGAAITTALKKQGAVS